MIHQEMAATREESRPLVRLNRDNGKPEWQQVIDLFQQHGLPPPPWRLRDELVTWLTWARYGEVLDEQEHSPSSPAAGG